MVNETTAKMFTYLKPKTKQEIDDAFKLVDSSRLFTGWLYDPKRRDLYFAELIRRKSNYLETIDRLIRKGKLRTLYDDIFIIDNDNNRSIDPIRLSKYMQ